jgi:hypothetical protein
MVDHINRDTLDNRRANLRFCNKRQNSANSKKRRGTKSIYRGVSWNARSPHWRIDIKAADGSRIRRGFKSEVEAAKAYNELAPVHYGDFAHLNEIAA